MRSAVWALPSSPSAMWCAASSITAVETAKPRRPRDEHGNAPRQVCALVGSPKRSSSSVCPASRPARSGLRSTRRAPSRPARAPARCWSLPRGRNALRPAAPARRGRGAACRACPAAGGRRQLMRRSSIGRRLLPGRTWCGYAGDQLGRAGVEARQLIARRAVGVSRGDQAAEVATLRPEAAHRDHGVEAVLGKQVVPAGRTRVAAVVGFHRGTIRSRRADVSPPCTDRSRDQIGPLVNQQRRSEPGTLGLTGVLSLRDVGHQPRRNGSAVVERISLDQGNEPCSWRCARS